MKKILIAALLIVAVGLGIFYFSGSEQVETITLRLADNQPEGYPTVTGAKEFARLVEERTEGRIKIQIFTGGVLGDESSTIEQLQFGAIDFVRTSISPMANFEPAMNVLMLPFLYESGDQMFEILQSKIGDNILTGLEKHDIVGLTWYDAGARSFYTRNKQVRGPEDLAGLRIRVQESPLYMDLVKALGASSTPMAWGEVYSGLQTGVVDAAENNFPGWYANSHHEVAPYFVVDEHSRIPELIIMSKKTWDGLNEADREIIKQAAIESTDVQRKAWAEYEAKAEENAIANGATVTYLTAEEKQAYQDKVKSLYTVYAKGYEDILNNILNFSK